MQTLTTAQVLSSLLATYALELTDTNTETATTYGTLMSYDTAETIRPATAEERAASIDAAKRDGGAGVIPVHGRSCYVED